MSASGHGAPDPAVFGTERCTMESDYSADEKAALFHRTAARIYGIKLPAT